MTSNANLARRQEIGLERRERTRLRLLNAAARVLAEHGEEKATIDDFVRAAGVARGTFYNHYRAIGELIDDLWLHIGHDPFVAIQKTCAPIESPAERLAAKARLVLRVAEQDKTWGWVVYSLSRGDTTVNEELLGYPRPDLEDGLHRGEFRFDDLVAATDLVVGSLRSALHALLSEERSSDYAGALCELLLRALGVRTAKARRIAHRAPPPLENLPPRRPI